jgi:ABC-type multidrug transport system ATPase subunit
MIEIVELTKIYRKAKAKALDGVSLSIKEGEVFGLIGPNGAGKTTLVQCLLGLSNPTSGSILINGKVPNHISNKRILAFLPATVTLAANNYQALASSTRIDPG